MPSIFQTIDKLRPAYDVVYKVVLFICKILLIADIAITSFTVLGRYIPFIPLSLGPKYLLPKNISDLPGILCRTSYHILSSSLRLHIHS